MSENLDLVRSIYADWERGDFSRSDWADPQIEFELSLETQYGRWTGLAGMANAWGDFLRLADGFRLLVDEYREIDPEHVLVLTLTRRGGRELVSELDLAQVGNKTAAVFQIRKGRVTRLAVYIDRHRAFADLGLTPRGDAFEEP
jgi:ketosteroid isomerase-like protein